MVALFAMFPGAANALIDAAGYAAFKTDIDRVMSLSIQSKPVF